MSEVLNHVPFPHILTAPWLLPNKSTASFRFANSEQKKVGDKVVVYSERKLNDKTKVVEKVFDVFVIREFVEPVRPPKGDWTNWECHPYYHNTIAQHIGQQFESDL